MTCNSAKRKRKWIKTINNVGLYYTPKCYSCCMCTCNYEGSSSVACLVLREYTRFILYKYVYLQSHNQMLPFYWFVILEKKVPIENMHWGTVYTDKYLHTSEYPCAPIICWINVSNDETAPIEILHQYAITWETIKPAARPKHTLSKRNALFRKRWRTPT